VLSGSTICKRLSALAIKDVHILVDRGEFDEALDYVALIPNVDPLFEDTKKWVKDLRLHPQNLFESQDLLEYISDVEEMAVFSPS
jgi:hypothetical protein